MAGASACWACVPCSIEFAAFGGLAIIGSVAAFVSEECVELSSFLDELSF